MVSLIVMGHVQEPNTRLEVKNDACMVDVKTRVSGIPRRRQKKGPNVPQ